MGKKNKRYDREKIMELYREGKSAEEIGAATGAPPHYIRQIIKWKTGVIVDDRPRRVDKGKIRALSRAGWSVDEIVYETGLRPDQITEVLNEQM